MSYEIWTNSKGEWTTKPPKADVTIEAPYTFSFPGRTVNNVSIRKFNVANDGPLFTASRNNEPYDDYRNLVGTETSNPVVIPGSLTGKGTSSITFKANMDGKLNAATPYDVIVNELNPSDFGPLVQAQRYYFPIVFEIELNGQLEVHHFNKDGTNIDSDFPDQSKSIKVGDSLGITPATNSKYTYNGYKKSVTSSPSGGSIITGNPPALPYDGTYDTYYLNLYYDKKADGKAHVRRLTSDGQSLSSVFPDQDLDMNKGTNYPFPHPTNASYAYKGYLKTTTGTPPSVTGTPTTGDFGLTPYEGSFNELYLYQIYDPVGEIGEVNIRHMVRTGTTGTFAQRGEDKKSVPLPHTYTYSPDAIYGTVVGKSISFTSYSNTVGSGASAYVSLTSAGKKVYITFFYEEVGNFTGDFDVLPNKIPYKNSFSLHPRDFQMNGCTYQGHYFRIDRAGSSWEGNLVTSQTTDSNFSFSSYPWVIGVGVHDVYMKIKTSCGVSNWIGPKPLTVTGPTNNNPPNFDIGFVRPSQPTIALHEVIEGTVLDLIYINDPSVPTPTDPDGDSLYFMGFDYSKGTSFVQSIYSKSVEYGDGQHQLTMDTLGYHNICGQMRDEFGATATACTYINVVPKNPVPIIKCPIRVIANHPIADTAFDPSRSYSPMGLAIDHSRDEWKNKQTSYVNDTGMDIAVQVSLDVYDSSGLKSLAPDTCTIIVAPDLPPIAKLVVPPLSVRGTLLDMVNKSTSPDGDPITVAEYKYKYDSNNNGFADDAWVTATGTLAKLPFTPTKVGKYFFYLKVTEQYGMWDDTASDSIASLTLNVVNNAPEVSFDMVGKNPQPDLDPYTRITPTDMLDWGVYVPQTDTLVTSKENLWEPKPNQLVSGEGRNFGAQSQNIYEYNKIIFGGGGATYDELVAQRLVDNGYGPNRLSPWRASTTYDPKLSAPLLDPATNDWFQYPAYLSSSGALKIRSTKKNVIFDKYSSTYEYNYNTQSGKYTNDRRIYGLNPKKLSPIDFIVGNGGSITKKYKNGSPYDYVIGFKGGSKSLKYNDAGVVRNIIAYPNYIGSWELADGYIYAFRYWDAYINSKSRTLVDLAVYDSRTGVELRSSLDSVVTQKALEDSAIIASTVIDRSKGYKIIVSTTNSWYANPGAKIKTIYEINPDLTFKKLSDWMAPAPKISSTIWNMDTYKLGYRIFGTFYDATGSMYTYEGYDSTNGTGFKGVADLNITKYNSDYAFVWRTYLSTEDRNVLGLSSLVNYLDMYMYNDNSPFMFINPLSGELYARTHYDQAQPGNMIPDMVKDVDVLNTRTGAITKHLTNFNNKDNLAPYLVENGPNGLDNPLFYLDRNTGKTQGSASATSTIEGYRTDTAITCGGYDNWNSRSGYSTVYDKDGKAVGQTGSSCNEGKNMIGEYFGDGVYVSMSTPPCQGCTYPSSLKWLNISVGKPSTAPALVKAFTSGQFYSPTPLTDAEVKFNFRIDDVDYDNEWLGYTFRMQNRKNGYAFETDAKKVQLVSYKNGIRSVLETQDYELVSGKSYAVKLLMVGNKFDLFIDNTPIFSTIDDTYASGRYGYFNSKSFVTFSSLAYKALTENIVWSDQYAIWDEGTAKAEVEYNNILFDDPESDPAVEGKYDWSVAHTVRFIHNQGLSGLDGKTFHDAQLNFDKVGDYVIKLKAKDDPNPDYLFPSNTFDEYRKSSNEFTKRITVHRRPVSDFSTVQGTDGKVVWTDRSHDPDRYMSATDYSKEATGIDYKLTKGVVEKKFYHITPSGKYVTQKLVTPTEVGTYEIGMAVKDEYGAWSNWYVVMLPVGSLPAPNNPPVPGFTTSYINTFRGVPITIDSTAHDIEDGGRENLIHDYYMKNVTTGGAESNASSVRTSWSKTFSSLGTFNIRQVVEDSDGATAQYELQVTINNRKPSAVVTMPTSTDQLNPTKLMVLRPDFTWSYLDPDNDTQTQYQAKIYKYGGILQLDSGVKNGSIEDWIPASDLPEKVNMFIVVRVFDGYEWSDYSAPKFFYIETNRPPTADFDWSPKPVYEGDILMISHTIDDLDKDTLSVNYVVTDPGGVSKTYSSSLPFPYAMSGPVFQALKAGTYKVALTVSDGKAPPVVVRKNIIVLPLMVAGQVGHTALWDQRRKDYNLSESKNEDSPRGYEVFWAGEKFILSAQTTITGTLTQAERVVVTMNSYKVELTASNDDHTRWNGELWEESLEKLANGPITFTFKAIYNNGTIKISTVTVTINGNVQQLYGVHRRN
ncbi:hypothetical protein FHS14_002421 [Paenibacillus baekrokdamisoli]|nr:hypothetical protein [Paenibacillus baekrokdamisoli]MBB3069431.1 hypothetical protein [Paenibacillus baekrokdamisoli]